MEEAEFGCRLNCVVLCSGGCSVLRVFDEHERAVVCKTSIGEFDGGDFNGKEGFDGIYEELCL